jgi:hypothetical protein
VPPATALAAYLTLHRVFYSIVGKDVAVHLSIKTGSILFATKCFQKSNDYIIRCEMFDAKIDLFGERKSSTD